jgi:hypothetical protein
MLLVKLGFDVWLAPGFAGWRMMTPSAPIVLRPGTGVRHGGSTMEKTLTALLMIALAGCSVTEKETPATPELSGSTTGGSGFLSPETYAKLQTGTKDQIGLVYINPNVNWAQYNKVMIASVTMGLGPNNNVSEQDQQMLASYYYHALAKDLSKDFTLVNQPGPGVMTVAVALTDATTATPVLRTISVVIPQARLLNAVDNMATGSYAFVGSAQSEGEITDSVTGQVLAAGVDKRSGGLSIKNADVWQWGDAKNAMDFWAQRTATRLHELRSGTTPIS